MEEISNLLGGRGRTKPKLFAESQYEAEEKLKLLRAQKQEEKTAEMQLSPPLLLLLIVVLVQNVSSAIKTIMRVHNILTEMGFSSNSNKFFSDNEAMINFIKVTGVAKGIRHLELWYVREEISKGKVDVFFMPGKDMPTDQLTKILTRAEFEAFRDRIQGLKLLAPNEDLQED